MNADHTRCCVPYLPAVELKLVAGLQRPQRFPLRERSRCYETWQMQDHLSSCNLVRMERRRACCNFRTSDVLHPIVDCEACTGKW